LCRIVQGSQDKCSKYNHCPCCTCLGYRGQCGKDRNVSVCVELSKVAKKSVESAASVLAVLVLANMGNAINIGLFVFVLHHPR
jgi:hypothetical protein